MNIRVQRNGQDIDGRRVGVTVPYSPEFADLEPDPVLLRHLAELTGGEVYTEGDAELARLARSGTLFRPAPETVKAILPFWFGLLFAAGTLFVLDVAVRRVTLDAPALWIAAARRWRHLHAPRPRTRSAELDQLLR